MGGYPTFMPRFALWLLFFLIGPVRAAMPVATDLSSAWQDAQDAVKKSPVRRVHHSTSEPQYGKSQVYGFSKAGTVLVALMNPKAHTAAFGAGFYVNGQGDLLTNAHVIRDAEELLVYVNDREVFSARVVAVDEDLDLAVLHLNKATPEVVPLSGESPPDGTEVVSVGYPRITDDLYTGRVLHSTLVQGTVNSMVFGQSRQGARMVPFLQIVGHINVGNSGGPVIDTATGRVVAVMTNVVPYLERVADKKGQPIAKVQLTSGISYAVPVETIRAFLVKNKIEIAGGEPRPAVADRAPSAQQYFATGDLLIAMLAALGNDDVDIYDLAAAHFRAALELNPSDAASAKYINDIDNVLKTLKGTAAAIAPPLAAESKPQQ